MVVESDSDGGAGQTCHTLRGHTGFIQSLAHSREGRRLLSASQDGTERLWDASSGRELLVFQPEGGNLPERDSARFTANERGILVLYRDGTAHRWDAATPEQVIAWGWAASAARAPRR